MFFNFPQDFKTKEPSPGFLLHTVWGERMMFSHVTLQPHAEVATHQHPHEQMGIVLEGEFEMTIGNENSPLKKGDMYLVPPDVTHGVVTHSKVALVLDVFSPPREDLK